MQPQRASIGDFDQYRLVIGRGGRADPRQAAVEPAVCLAGFRHGATSWAGAQTGEQIALFVTAPRF